MKEFPQIVKNKKTVYTVKQVFLDFIEFDELWRREREKSQIYKGFSCFNCEKKFIDGEKMSVLVTDKRNKVACKKCGEKLLEQALKAKSKEEEI